MYLRFLTSILSSRVSLAAKSLLTMTQYPSRQQVVYIEVAGPCQFNMLSRIYRHVGHTVGKGYQMHTHYYTIGLF